MKMNFERYFAKCFSHLFADRLFFFQHIGKAAVFLVSYGSFWSGIKIFISDYLFFRSDSLYINRKDKRFEIQVKGKRTFGYLIMIKSWHPYDS